MERRITYGVVLRYDIGKPRCLHAFLHSIFLEEVDWVTNTSSGFLPDLAPLHHSMIIVHTAIIRVADSGSIDMLNPAARLAASVSLPVDLRPVLRSTAEPPKMNVVKVVGFLEGPFFVEVIDLEAEVRGHPAGLDGRDIGTNHLAHGEFIGKVDRPQACSRTNVNGIFGFLCNRSCVKLAIVEKGRQMVTVQKSCK